MTFLAIYFLGAYIACLVFSLLLDNKTFREYLEELLFILTKPSEKLSSIHSYGLLIPTTIIISLLSWVGLIIIFFAIIDLRTFED